jgi:hypothetical protein
MVRARHFDVTKGIDISTVRISGEDANGGCSIYLGPLGERAVIPMLQCGEEWVIGHAKWDLFDVKREYPRKDSHGEFGGSCIGARLSARLTALIFIAHGMRRDEVLAVPQAEYDEALEMTIACLGPAMGSTRPLVHEHIR